MPSVDDELEEIKKLLESDITGTSFFSKGIDPAGAKPDSADVPLEHLTNQAELEFFSAPIISEKTVPKSGPPAVRRMPGLPLPKQTPGVPAVRQAPGVPQIRQAPGTPQVRQTPGTPQVRQVPEAPAILQRGQPPARSRRLAPIETDDGADRFRSYDITDDGKITKSSDDEQELDIGAENFKVKFDFESAYKDVPEQKPLRLRREKRTGCVGGILYGAFVISISLLLATLLWMAAVDVLGFGAEDEQINVTVPANFDIEDVTDMLYDSGLIKYKFLFNLYAGFSNAEEKIAAGSYVLNSKLDYRSLVQGMTARGGVRVETTVTIPEGFSMSQIFTLLEDYGVVSSANELWEAAENHDFNYSFLDKDTLGERYRLEGFLFPETHNFYLNSTPVQALTILLREFNRRWTEDYEKRAEDMGYSVRDIIIIASMIEREAGNDEERPRIAAVIYNRLNSNDFPLLQIDATIHYAIAGTGRPFSTGIDHPYNTYMYEGLPPGPISNPGMASIRAALYPESTNEYYYALNKEGSHNFFRTFAQHDAFVKSDDYGG